MSKAHDQLAAALYGHPYVDSDTPPTPSAREHDEQRRRTERTKDAAPANAHQILLEALGGEPVVDADRGRHAQLARALGLTR
jgi:hypothetical protein